MPVIRTRRPGTEGPTSLLLAARSAAAGGGPLGRGPRGRQALLDRVEPPPDRAEFGPQLAQVVRRGGPALVDRIPDALPDGSGAGLRAAHDLVDGVLRAGAGRLSRLPRRLKRALDRLPDGVG